MRGIIKRNASPVPSSPCTVSTREVMSQAAQRKCCSETASLPPSQRYMLLDICVMGSISRSYRADVSCRLRNVSSLMGGNCSASNASSEKKSVEPKQSDPRYGGSMLKYAPFSRFRCAVPPSASSLLDIHRQYSCKSVVAGNVGSELSLPRLIASSYGTSMIASPFLMDRVAMTPRICISLPSGPLIPTRGKVARATRFRLSPSPFFSR